MALTDVDRPPLVSVVIPTYERAALVPDAIDSVLGQTWARIEAIVVDDGSTDGTSEMLALRYGDDPRVRVTRQRNHGLSSARNLGLREARGTFVGFLDSDDRYVPTCVADQLGFMAAHPEADLVIGDVRYVGDWKHGAERMFVHPDWSPPTTLEALLAGTWANTCGWILRTETARRYPFDETFRVAEDTELLARLLADGRQVMLNDVVVAHYRKHDGADASPQITDDWSPFDAALYAIRERYHGRVPNRTRSDVRTRRRVARHLVDEGRWAEARPHVWFWWTRRLTSRTAWSYLVRTFVPWSR